MRLSVLPACLLVCMLFSCKKNKDAEPIPNNKALAWIKTYGGPDYDFGTSVVQLSSGEYVIAGSTRSNGGDIPGSRFGYDALLTKVDLNGNKVWNQTYGANDDDYGTGVVATADGGFIMVGYAFNNNVYHSWAVKTNSTGAQTWMKQLSSSSDAKPNFIISAGDGSYLVGGYTTATTKDAWIARIDESGNQLWAKTFGGTGDEMFTSAVKTADGGFVLSGYSTSNNGDIPVNRGNFDGLVVKIDASGNKQWSNTYGGSDEDYLKSVIQLSDNSIVLAGYTKSRNGDIAQNKGGYDEWLIKLDASGNKQWIKTYGGGNEEYITKLIASADGGFVTIGYTNSTTGDVTRTYNDFGAWLLRMDANGNKVATSTYGERYDDFANDIIRTQDGGYIVVGYTDKYAEGKGYEQWFVKIDNF